MASRRLCPALVLRCVAGADLAAVEAAEKDGAKRCYVDVAFGDEEKLALFESIGFGQTGPGRAFELAGDELASIRLERDAGREA